METRVRGVPMTLALSELFAVKDGRISRQVLQNEDVLLGGPDSSAGGKHADFAQGVPTVLGPTFDGQTDNWLFILRVDDADG